MKFDVVSLGPARMDCFVSLPEDEVTETCSVDKQACTISLGFGDKIPVKAMQFAIGGNTGNNAVGLARLGYKTAMLGTMGGEWVDKQAMEVLKNEKVNVENVSMLPGKFGFGVIIGYQGERTILSYYPDADCNFTLKKSDLETSWIYLTTAGENYECFYQDAVGWAKERGVKIAFNPGSRQIKDGADKLKYVFAATDLLFVNREEAAKFLKTQPADEMRDLLSGMKTLGPKMVVITDGQEGAYGADGEKYWQMPIVAATVVERTGAGDAFGSGFMAAMLAGKTVPEALKWGACNSASVLGFVGPQEGLLTLGKMQKWLEKNSSIEAKEI